jgi:hypothetical protein
MFDMLHGDSITTVSTVCVFNKNTWNVEVSVSLATSFATLSLILDIIPCKIPSPNDVVCCDVGKSDHLLCVRVASCDMISSHSFTLILLWMFSVFADVSRFIIGLIAQLWLFSHGLFLHERMNVIHQSGAHHYSSNASREFPKCTRVHAKT